MGAPRWLQLTAAAALAATLASGGAGCFFTLDGSLVNRKDGAVDLTGEGVPDGAVVDADLGGDLPAAEAGDGPGSDATPPEPFSCGTPEALESGSLELIEPAISRDGLSLVARVSGENQLHVNTRGGTAQQFTSWSAYAGLPSSAQDPAFFRHGGENQAMIALRVAQNPRVLRHCATLPASSCSTISITEGAQPLDEDTDGPSVAVVGDSVIMAFNYALTGVTDSGRIYLAKPAGASGLDSWIAEAQPQLHADDSREDDPTISRDGLAIVFVSNRDGDDDLWAAYRASVGEDFGLPIKLEGVNSSSEEQSPDLGRYQLADEHDHELFFTSARSGTVRIYRTICSR